MPMFLRGLVINRIPPLLLSSGLVLLPVDAVSQETRRSPDLGVEIAALGGYTSAYRGGATHLVSARFSRLSGLPIEVAFEYTPTPMVGNAKIFWLGLQSPDGAVGKVFYAGARGGFVDGPSYDGVLADLHVGLQVDWRSLGIRLEPALLGGFDETLFLGRRLAAGLTWSFR